MNRFRPALIALVATGMLLYGLVWLATTLFLGPEYHAKLRRFDRVRPGMCEQEVKQILGEPSARGTKFYLAQEQYFEHEYRRAATSGSRVWWFWSSGDHVMTVGFSRHGRVTMTSQGGT